MKKLFAVILVAVLTISLSGCGVRGQYKSAMEEFNNGNYNQAANMFSEILDYKDSEEMEKKSIYFSAVDEYYAGNHIGAIRKFGEILDYENSKEQINHILMFVLKKSNQEVLSTEYFFEVADIYGSVLPADTEEIQLFNYYIGVRYLGIEDFYKASQFLYRAGNVSNAEEMYDICLRAPKITWRDYVGKHDYYVFDDILEKRAKTSDDLTFPLSLQKVYKTSIQDSAVE